MAVKRNYRINLRNYGNSPAIMVSQYDENYDLVFEVYDGVVPATGLNAYTVKLVGRQPGNDPALKYEFTGTVSGIANNILSFTIDTTMTGRAGKGTAEIVILDTTNDVKFASFNLPVYVEKAAVPDDAIDADVERAQEIADEVAEIVDGATEGAEAWAVGQRGGVDVESTDPTYHNNAKYYAEQAQDIADSIGIDATLSITGKAADAKKTGDEISSLKEDLNAISDMQNITAKVTGFEQGYRHGRQNASLVVNSKCVCTTAVVEFKAGQTISIASGYEYMIVDPDPANNGALLITRRATDYTFAEATSGYVEVRTINGESDITPGDVSGIVVTVTTSFRIVSIAQNAYDRAFKIIKFVSTSGNDANTGDSPSTAYATIGKALSETADVIYIAKGTYIEDLTEYTAYRYRGIKIVADGATLISNDAGLHFRFANVDISGLSVISGENPLTTTKSGFHLLNCTGKLTDCSADGFPNMGIRIDGCRMTLTRCFAINNGVDGFNGHTVNDGYDTECTLIDCVAYGNGDDGASIHENGKMFVYGGEYYDNVQTGLAPHDKCVFEAFNVHCHHNGKGIEAVKDTLASGETPAIGMVIGCILDNNTTYGLDVKNYTVNTLANGYADNGTAPTNTQTGGTINALNIAESGDGAGGGSIETLSDVQISNLSNGQHLTYDSTTSKWKNVTLSGGSIQIDSEISGTSENPVQNKVIKTALDAKADANAVVTSVNGSTGAVIIGTATTQANGLMSSTDKDRLDTLYADYSSALTALGVS